MHDLCFHWRSNRSDLCMIYVPSFQQRLGWKVEDSRWKLMPDGLITITVESISIMYNMCKYKPVSLEFCPRL